MKTIGEIAYEADARVRGNAYMPWSTLGNLTKEHWESVARAVAFAVEEAEAEHKRASCERGPSQPTGLAPSYGHHFTCRAAPDPLYPGYLAKVRA